MNDIAKVISRLEQQRATIDRALSALREVEGLGPAEAARDRRSRASAQKSTQTTTKQAPARGSKTAPAPQFTGNKTEFIRTLVEARGRSGAVPQDIAEVFAARRIRRSRNLIYNVLSALVKQKKLKKTGDRYFSTPVGSLTSSTAPKKQRISPEGIKRIIAANKRRAAKRKAAESAHAPGAQHKPSAGKAASSPDAAKKLAAEKTRYSLTVDPTS